MTLNLTGLPKEIFLESVGDKSEKYYSYVYDKVAKNEIFVWNWAAALFGFSWLFYRRLYKEAILGYFLFFSVLLFLTKNIFDDYLLIGIVFLFSLLCGGYGNYFYIASLCSKAKNQRHISKNKNFFGALFFSLSTFIVSVFTVVQGDPLYNYSLGLFYYCGYGEVIKKDLKKAAYLFQEAADRGIAGAQYNLGIIYYNGEDVEKNISKAADFFQKSANQGYAGAQGYLGVLYYKGEGVEKNIKKSVELLEKSANQGDVRKENDINGFYEEGATKEFQVAMNLSLKVADQGIALAQYHLGILYLHGEGVTKDPKKAAELFQKSSSKKAPSS